MTDNKKKNDLYNSFQCYRKSCVNFFVLFGNLALTKARAE